MANIEVTKVEETLNHRVLYPGVKVNTDADHMEFPISIQDRGSDATLGRQAHVALARPFCTSIAQRTASTTLRNSIRLPSPVRLTMRPRYTTIVGSIRSLRSARSRAKVRSSSVPAERA